MKLNRPSRSVVALLTAMLLVLCQSASAAQACFGSLALQGDASVATAPCHTESEDSNTLSHQPAAASVCDASEAVAETAGVPIFPPADLAPLVVAAYEAADITLAARTPQALHTVCSSPPLTVLHCRFLI